jgi:eukaryotic-like serine/threonine-protein kinase
MNRISRVALILFACFVSLAWGQRNGWSEFHRPDMMRWNVYENVLNVNNVGNLSLKWKYQTGGTVFDSPTVANGVVYVGSNDGNVYALNASTGAKLWSYTIGPQTPLTAVANGVVYVAGGNLNKTVYALNASTGALLWSYTTSGYVSSSPTVANGVVYVGSAYNNNVYANKVYALNAKTGAKLWTYSTGGDVYSSPTVADGVVYVGSYDDNVYAFGLQ